MEGEGEGEALGEVSAELGRGVEDGWIGGTDGQAAADDGHVGGRCSNRHDEDERILR